MTQCNLIEEISGATGESLMVDEHLGCLSADPPSVDYDAERRRPLVFDWDTLSPTEWPGD